MINFAVAYADQTEKDYGRLLPRRRVEELMWQPDSDPKRRSRMSEQL